MGGVPRPRPKFEIEDLTARKVKASELLAHAPDILRAGDRVVLNCRASGREQERLGTLGRQVAFLRDQAEALGPEVVGAVACALSGWPGVT